MYYEFNKHKRKDAIKWVAIFLVVILLLVAVSALWSKGYKTINPYCWGDKHTYGEDGICINCGAEKPVEDEKDVDDNGGMAMDDSIIGNGIMLMSIDIPRALYGEYDIAPIAETAKQLTATITPADATNKVVDWSVAWKNSNSAWAKGKAVSSYVTVTPTSDGALTANVACLKAFGEQVIVTVAVRDDTAITATATVDYEQRVIGFDFSIKNNWTENSSATPVNWSFVSSNLNPTVDFVRLKSGDTIQNWSLGFADGSNTTATVTPHYSDYTKAKSTYQGAKVSVAPTATYIAALKAAGFTTSATAGTYAYSVSTGGATVNGMNVAGMLLDKYISDSTKAFKTFNQYTTLRNYLKSNASSVMLQIKIEILGGNSNDAVTVYNVKFSSASLTALAEGVSIGSNIVF